MSEVSGKASKFDFKITLLIISFCFIWASAFGAAKFGLQYWSPLWFLATRFLLTSLFFLLLTLIFAKFVKLSKKQWIGISILGLLNNAGYLGFAWYSLSIPGTSSGLVATMISANPILVTLGQFILIKSSFSVKKLIGVILGFIGVFIILQSRISFTDVSMNVIYMLIFAMFSFSMATLFFTQLNQGVGFLQSLTVQNLAGGLALLIPALMFETMPDNWTQFEFLLAMFYLVVVIGLSFVLWFNLIRIKGTSEASAYHFLMPPIGLFYGWIFFNEYIPPLDYLGLIPISLGIFLVTRKS